ncbi:MAG TPA: Holliday junction ATP-dependent DNA helicase RuvA [Armatimonadota bacterium]|jgi:Holliday junction DNA helicase RuvA|nr:Holliday junction branch migration protein RuvA [Armatimonadota bacterium]HOJ21047.1 Holliday junction ATP-dependent DNA helicase RuvA [Armatimonadota bacterium]HOM81458.1 Holliday junction ATP-dependent DNA helicase RuvA [Armatimonadota bacterium]HOQ30005.1 Holliday junction ATP-dependent DNA helicase RuvA [Armatimonadota bacterium]HPO71670.1 Holliday junction ATP-dependent DNA helicase RuvA [Armatimonadota bacterium]
MIGYLRGNLVELEDERVILCVGGVGYEVILPAIEMRALRARLGEALYDQERLRAQEVELYIYEHIADRQPNTLFGFNQRLEKEFFRLLITVSDIGPATAAKAMAIPVAEIAAAIERRDTRVLSSLPGIGKRKAEQMVATLKGKSLPFCLAPIPDLEEAPPPEDVSQFVKDVQQILVEQLGYKPHEAEAMVTRALQRRPELTDAQALLEEIWTGERPS